MSSEEYDIWGMPIRPPASAPGEDEDAPQESAPSEDAPAPVNAFTPEPVAEAVTDDAPILPATPTVAPKPVTVSDEEIAAALAAVNAVAAKSPVEQEATVVPGPAAVGFTETPAEEKASDTVAPAVDEPEPPRVEAVASPLEETPPEPVVVATAAGASVAEPVAETPVAAEMASAETTSAEDVAQSAEVVAAESPVAPAVVAAAALTDEPSGPIDVWGDAPKTAAAVVATAAVASAVAEDATRLEVADEAPKQIANPLRRKRASRSSNDPVAPTPPQYVATPGAAPASTLSTSGATDPRYAISSTAAASAASPYALTPTSAAASPVSAAPVASQVAPPLSTPVTTPIPPASTPMATPPSEPVPVYTASSTPEPPPAALVAAPMVTPAATTISPGSMPVIVPTAAAAAAVLSSAGMQTTRAETYAPPVAPRPRQAAEAKIEVINPEGWHRDFPLKKTILYVGSAPGADIVLPSSEVAPRHLQFVPSSANKMGYRLINLGAAPVSVLGPTGGEPRIAAPRGSLEMNDGDRAELGGYGLVFHGGEVTSQQIQARLEVPNPRLSLEKPLDGALYIRNGGEKAGVQFVVEVQGIDTRFVQVEPGPVLFPGMEKRVAFRIAHPQTANPAAGDQPINFVVTAPEGYPGETAIASQVITVAPFFAHKVRLLAIEPEMSGFALSSGR